MVSPQADDVTALRFPVYVISKGRWESRLTSRSLEACGVPYHIVVEPQEADNYRAVIAPEKVLVLPFANLGQGSIPARNWAWEHALEAGHKRHWILDDNIRGFRTHDGSNRARVRDASNFLEIERHIERYENVALAAMQYQYFCPSSTTHASRRPPAPMPSRNSR